MVVVPLRGSSSGTVLLEGVDIILMGLLVSSERKLL